MLAKLFGSPHRARTRLTFVLIYGDWCVVCGIYALWSLVMVCRVRRDCKVCKAVRPFESYLTHRDAAPLQRTRCSSWCSFSAHRTMRDRTHRTGHRHSGQRGAELSLSLSKVVSLSLSLSLSRSRSLSHTLSLSRVSQRNTRHTTNIQSQR